MSEHLTPEEKKYVNSMVERAKERALRRAKLRRDFTLSLHFKKADVDAWKKAAEDAGTTLTAWLEKLANRAAKRK